VALLEADDMEAAVRLAVDTTADGGVVLFSPAAPTPEGGGGYGERSRQFIEASGLA
jgi:UDP-N-acetylmuramoylalanine-D-glutamate ligase